MLRARSSSLGPKRGGGKGEGRRGMDGAAAYVSVLGAPSPRRRRRAAAGAPVCRSAHVQSAVQRRASGAGRPLVAFLAGMDARPLPRSQLRHADERALDVGVVSLWHDKDDRSDWLTIAAASRSILGAACAEAESSELILVGESLGACMALAALRDEHGAPADAPVVSKLVLVNSATAAAYSPLVRNLAPLVSLLRVDTSGRLLYPLAAAVLWPWLTERSQLAEENVNRGSIASLPAVDIRSAPLSATIHRIALLRSFPLTDQNVHSRVVMPTLLLAGLRDRLFNSRKEAQRLHRLCAPHARVRLLPDSGHACLLERDVDMFSILCEEKLL